MLIKKQTMLNIFKKNNHNWTPISSVKENKLRDQSAYPSKKIKSKDIASKPNKISYPIIAQIYKVLQEQGKITVIDFGGGTANYYAQLLKFHQVDRSKIEWFVVETNKFIENLPKKNIKKIKYYNSINLALKNASNQPILLASGVLQYLSYEDLNKLSSCFEKFRYVLLDRVPTIKKSNIKYQDIHKNVITLQKDINCCCFFFEESFILNKLFEKFKLADFFDSVFDRQSKIDKKIKIQFNGYILKKNENS